MFRRRTGRCCVATRQGMVREPVLHLDELVEAHTAGLSNEFYCFAAVHIFHKRLPSPRFDDGPSTWAQVTEDIASSVAPALQDGTKVEVTASR